MIERDVGRAYVYSMKVASGKNLKTGGLKLTHEPTAYGVALKWLMYMRKMTYADFAKRYDGTTAQNINYLVNRMDKEKFLAEDVNKICEILGVSYEYFIELCKKIEEKMEK